MNKFRAALLSTRPQAKYFRWMHLRPLCHNIKNLDIRRTMCSILHADPKSISFASLDSAPSFASNDSEDALKAAADVLRRNELVAFPTETVYGLGANALQSEAVSKIFSTKNRPADNPLIVHVSSLSMLRSLVSNIPDVYEPLIKKFWPGPLTLLFPLAQETRFSDLCTAGQSTIGLRMPSHPVARALIHLADRPIAAPSANTSGRPSPTTAAHVLSDMSAANKIITILDGGSCGVGVESTVVDGLTTPGVLKILRPGGVGADILEQASNARVQVYGRDWTSEAEQAKPSTPGMKYKHYSPKCPVTCYIPSGSGSEHQLPQAKDTTGLLYLEPSRLPSNMPGVKISLGPRFDAKSHARRLFDGLRELEKAGCEEIWVECPAEEENTWDLGVGYAVKERLGKSAGGRDWVKIAL